MTNEQLAMLLQGYATRLGRIMGGLVRDLEGVEVERETQLQFEVKPESEHRSGAFLYLQGCEISATEVQAGDPVILQPLKSSGESWKRRLKHFWAVMRTKAADSLT